MPYAIHLRKSRADIEAEARGEGESLSRHQQRLRALADRMELDVVAEYREIISGDKLSDRPEMQRLLADVSSGKYDGVLTVEVSRLTRGDLMDQGLILNTFKYSGTRIITPEHTYDLSEDWDEDVITSDMMMARREYKYIKRRLQRGRLASANEGLWQSPAPFGYRKIKVPRGKGWTLAPDPEQAALVRMIYRMYAEEDAGGSKVARRLNALGSRTNKGNAWTASGVGQLVRNPVYMGCVRWNDRVSVTRMVGGTLCVRREKCATPVIVQGRHEPLVSPELWEAAQRSKRAHDRVHCHNAAPVRNPLAGLVRCAICGRTMVRKDNGNARGSRYDMLRCTTPDCPTTATALSIVERSVLATLEGWLLTCWETEPAAQPDRSRDDALEAARAQLQRLHAQRDRIFAAYEDGAYDTATFVRRRAEKDGEIEQAERALADLERHAAPSEPEAILAQLPQIRHVLDAYALAQTPEEKNRLLRTVIAHVDYSKTARCTRGQNPAEHLTLTVHPLMPGPTGA